ncbi:MAG TPA: phosphonate metabolism protein/1,5-bisphosphokinase (PRPP-forming) PhnN [Dongiaceae bacterium]|nr:phosphonate metabolism protein/1,5-bisphosphokinase (PRPP-forming) PhnN [Dongiaceae bacterium]
MPGRLVPGRLIYVMGPSGAGKDSVINFARIHGDPVRAAFAHRYITRPPAADAENHISLSEAEFETRKQVGWFALDWHSHGLRYGIGREIDLWLASGVAVVINGSRAYLAEAASRYPDLQPVLITAPAEIRLARLQSRQRESGGDIQARIDRQVDLANLSRPVCEIDNSHALAAAGARLLELLEA